MGFWFEGWGVLPDGKMPLYRWDNFVKNFYPMKSNKITEWIGYDQFITDSDWIIAIDPGHGGIINGEYLTAPDKMYNHKEFTFYEGVFNRAVSGYLAELLLRDNLSHFFTTVSNYDPSLSIRVTRGNNFKRKYDKKQLFLSIHGNAAPKGSEKASGIEVYTSKGETKADQYATEFFKELAKLGWVMRKDMYDGDPDKESMFYVLKYTKAPAILVELGFYTNLREAELMMQEEVQQRLAKALFDAIKKITKHNNDAKK